MTNANRIFVKPTILMLSSIELFCLTAQTLALLLPKQIIIILLLIIFIMTHYFPEGAKVVKFTKQMAHKKYGFDKCHQQGGFDLNQVI